MNLNLSISYNINVRNSQTLKIITTPLPFPGQCSAYHSHRRSDHSINVGILLDSTLHVHNMLQKIPKNKNKIAILVNSQGGCMAQTHIILNKINLLAKRNQAQVWTFGQ